MVGIGTETAFEAAAKGRALEAQGRKITRLNVSHAFHSPLMEPMLEEFAAVARSVSFKPPQLPIISSLSGQPAAGIHGNYM